jgi:hypothetical protein
MFRLHSLYYEMQYERDMDIALSSSFEHLLNENENKKIIKLKSRKKEWDKSFTTFRCNKVNPLCSEKCSICQYGFKSNQIVRNTCEKCYFHALCIDRWLVNVNKCPNCMVIILNYI